MDSEESRWVVRTGDDVQANGLPSFQTETIPE